ncbi:hypothetical protein [Lusitaniella coriacea]|nr:hypothetical protein [Lusitaniella coriacea]
MYLKLKHNKLRLPAIESPQSQRLNPARQAGRREAIYCPIIGFE